MYDFTLFLREIKFACPVKRRQPATYNVKRAHSNDTKNDCNSECWSSIPN
jgi:hypothetical protein